MATDFTEPSSVGALECLRTTDPRLNALVGAPAATAAAEAFANKVAAAILPAVAALSVDLSAKNSVSACVRSSGAVAHTTTPRLARDDGWRHNQRTNCVIRFASSQQRVATVEIGDNVITTVFQSIVQVLE
jgi:hypothetical protein